MNTRLQHLRFLRRRLAWPFWVALLTAYSAMAASVVIDALHEDYRGLASVAATNGRSSEAERGLSASQLAAVHRARSPAPFSTLPPGSTLKVVWPDGSSEYVVVVDPSSSAGVQSIPGTRRAAGGEVLAEGAVPAPRQGLPR